MPRPLAITMMLHMAVWILLCDGGGGGGGEEGRRGAGGQRRGGRAAAAASGGLTSAFKDEAAVMKNWGKSWLGATAAVLDLPILL